MSTRRNHTGRRAVSHLSIHALLQNKNFLLAIAIAFLVLIVLISSLVSRSKRIGLEKETTTLKEEVTELRAVVNRLEGEKVSLQSQLDVQTQQTAATQSILEDTVRAMDLFWQIDEAFVLGRNTRARELIQTLESEKMAVYLPRVSTTNNGRFSPYDRYAEICEALNEAYGAGVK